jgi:hypothetical protein
MTLPKSGRQRAPDSVAAHDPMPHPHIIWYLPAPLRRQTDYRSFSNFGYDLSIEYAILLALRCIDEEPIFSINAASIVLRTITLTSAWFDILEIAVAPHN